MQIIGDGRLSVTINTLGATLDSVKYLGEEYLWQGSEKSWDAKDIVIFPAIGRMRDGWYTVDGKRYDMPLHGFAHEMEFSVLEKGADFVTLSLYSDEHTKKCYPFNFALIIDYRVTGGALQISYRIENRGDVEMPFGFGTHFGFSVDGEECDDCTNTNGNLAVLDGDGNAVEVNIDDKYKLVKGTKCSRYANVIELDKAVFAHDAIVMENTVSNVTIKRKMGGEVNVKLGNPPYLALWSHEKFGAFVCVESWWGLPDEVEVVREMSEKLGISRLAAAEAFNCTITLNFKQAIENVQR